MTLVHSLPALPLLVVFAGTASSEPQRYAVDPASSRLTIHVGKTGLFRFAGHEHEVVGPLHDGVAVIDRDHFEASSVELTFEAAALRVTGRGEPPKDVPKVQQAMVGWECLDAGRFPFVKFESRAVEAKRGAGGAYELNVTGVLTLHGVSREVTFPTHLVFAKDSFTATGTKKLRQTEFGIKPISVAGVVKVKDEIVLEWHLVGRPAPGGHRR